MVIHKRRTVRTVVDDCASVLVSAAVVVGVVVTIVVGGVVTALV
jgi:hypothetical protein